MMMPDEYGLTLVVVGANYLKNVSTFGKLDPFVQITYGNEVYKTSVLKDGGRSPIWNYEVCLTGRIPYITIDVLDSQLFKPKLIGSVTIHLNELHNGVQHNAYKLYNKEDGKESTGMLLTKFTLFSISRNSNLGRIPHPSFSTPAIPTQGFPSVSSPLNTPRAFCPPVPIQIPHFASLPSVPLSPCYQRPGYVEGGFPFHRPVFGESYSVPQPSEVFSSRSRP